MQHIKRHTPTQSHHVLTLVAMLCLSVFPSASLHAQTTTQDLKEVIVQSGRLAQKQFDAPASVYAIDAQTIQGSGTQVNLSDVLASVPGVVALNRNNYAQDVQISMRGFGARSAFGVRGIRIITDDIPATIPDGQGQTSTVSMTSTERIEVLTGPLAQLYGNSSGGVIQTYTREAGDQPELRNQVMVGSYGMTRTDWQMSQRSGNVGIVADYSTFGISGYRDNSDARRQQLNSVITVDAKPDTRVKLIVNVFDMPYAKDPTGLNAVDASTKPTSVNSLTLLNGAQKAVSHHQMGVVVDHRFNSDLSAKARVYSGTRETLQYQAGTSTTTPTKATWVGLNRDFDGFGLQLNGKATLSPTQRMDWVVGFDQDHSVEQRQGGATQSGVKTGSLTRNESNDAKNNDYFAQANWHLAERWTLTTGARSSEVVLSSLNQCLDASCTAKGDTGSATYKATSPVFGVTWHARDDLNVYLNQGKGFETPTLSETAYQNTTNTGGFNLQASKSEHLEFGSKWLPNATSRVDAAWFHIKTDNEIAVDSSSGNTTYKNVGKTVRDGFEISGRTSLSTHWRTQASYNYISATYQEGFTGVPVGNSLPSVPARQLFSSIQWSEKGFALPGKKPALGTELSLDWMARSQIWATDLNTAGTSAPGFGTLNARARQRYQLGEARIEAFVGIDNLTNKDTIGSVIINQKASRYFEPGLPRTWVLGVQSQIPL
jgi:iron complex outermembrane receptor protein